VNGLRHALYQFIERVLHLCLKISPNFTQLCLFKVKLFADDVKMYIRILDDLDVRRLQLAFDALV